MSDHSDDPSRQFLGLETEQQPATRTVRKPSRIVVTAGRDAGVWLDIDPNAPLRLLVGTSALCDLILTDVTVSRRHFALEDEGVRYRLRDLGSTNGTFIGDVAVVEAFVRGGESVRIGDTVLRLESHDAMVSHPPARTHFGRVIGGSPSMRRLYVLAERLAHLDLPVLIEGPAGVGKELLAETIHEASARARCPYVILDCASILANEIESELFGDDRSNRERPGAIEEAHGGTLVIREVGLLDMPTQGKLLRVFDRGEARRVGSAKTVHPRLRIIATTSRDLDRDVTAGKFREDLLRRLAAGRVELPPLSARPGDVELLARHFLSALGGERSLITTEVLSSLADHAWPGNVAELKDAVARLIVLGEGGADSAFAASWHPSGAGPERDWLDALIEAEPRFPVVRRHVVQIFEERFVRRLLEAHGGNLTRAAAASGLALRYFRLMKSRRGRGA